MRYIIAKSDFWGAVASTLCMIHCLVTPVIFIAQACCSAGGCKSSPLWWQGLDYVFLLVAFFAVFYSAKNSSKSWMKPALWSSWGSLFLLIINEQFEWILLPSLFAHIMALFLALLHLYNLKYCQCQTDKCCIEHG